MVLKSGLDTFSVQNEKQQLFLLFKLVHSGTFKSL